MPLKPLILLCLLVWGAAAWGEDLRDDMEGTATNWRVAGGDAQYEMVRHQRTTDQAHLGASSEYVQLKAGGGTTVFMSREVAPLRAIDELKASVWVRSDRPGIQILARVMFPRIVDPATQKPVTTLVYGSGYTQVGNWQELHIEEFAKLVQRQSTMLRSRYGPSVDLREAQIDRIVLNIYGGQGSTQVWFDDLAITGGIDADPRTASLAGFEAVAEEAPMRLPAAPPSLPAGAPSIRLAGSLFEVNERPFFPRIVEYQGEKLSRLTELGFNGIRVRSLASDALLAEATALGLWVVTPPPPPEALAAESHLAKTRLDARFHRVLAWDLGENLTSSDLDGTRDWIRAIHQSDPINRPIFCEADNDLRGFSRAVDLLMVHRYPLGSSLSLAHYAQWLRERPQLARPGTQFWTTVQTQPSRQWHDQWATAVGGPAPPAVLQDEQLRQVTLLAIASGARGLAFQSLHPLDAPDATSRYRATMLALLNMELDLIEPWLAAAVTSSTATSTDPQVAAVVLQLSKAKLIIPYSVTPAAQLVTGAGSGGPASIIVPGAAAAEVPYEVTPAGLRPLLAKRIAGGLRITLNDGDRSTLIVMTQDPTVVGGMSKRIAQSRERAFQLQQDLVLQNQEAITHASQKLASSSNPKGKAEATSPLEQAEKLLAQIEGARGRKDLVEAFSLARRGGQLLRQYQRAEWLHSDLPFASAVASPFAGSFTTLPEHRQLMARLNSNQPIAPQAIEGGFEDLGRMREVGWRHFQFSREDVNVQVVVSAEQPHSGQYCLHLQALPKSNQAPAALEMPPVWITSPPVDVQAGDLVLLRGWVRVNESLKASVDGLVILDSFGGEPLAERILQTNGWKEIGLIRAAPKSGPFNVTLILSGLGQAWIDDLSLQVFPGGTASARQALGATAPAK